MSSRFSSLLRATLLAFLCIFGATFSAAQSPFAGGYAGESVVTTSFNGNPISTTTIPNVTALVNDEGGIEITSNGGVITGTVDDAGMITFDANSQGFQTGQISGETITAVATSANAGVDTETAFEAMFIGTLPSITAQPSDQSVPTGASVTLSVEAEGVDQYKWERDGLAIDGANGPMLTFAAASVDDVGNYRVRLCNAAGEVISDTVSLTVIPDTENPFFDGRQFRKILDGRTVLASGNMPFRFANGNAGGPQGAGTLIARAEEGVVFVNTIEREPTPSIFGSHSIYAWGVNGLAPIAGGTLNDASFRSTRLAAGPGAFSNDRVAFTTWDPPLTPASIHRGDTSRINTLFRAGLEGDSILGSEVGIDFGTTRLNVQNDGSYLFIGTRFQEDVGVGGFEYIPSDLYYWRNNPDGGTVFEIALAGGFIPEGSDKAFYPIDVGDFVFDEVDQSAPNEDKRLLAAIVQSNDRQVSGIAARAGGESPRLLVDSTMMIDDMDLDFFGRLQVFDDWIYFNAGNSLSDEVIARVNLAGTIEVLARTGTSVPDRPSRNFGPFRTLGESTVLGVTGNFSVSTAGVFFGSGLNLAADSNPDGAGFYVKPEGQPIQTIVDDRDRFDGRVPLQFGTWPYATRRNDSGGDDVVLHVGYGPAPSGGNGLYTNLIPISPAAAPEIVSTTLSGDGEVVLVFLTTPGSTYTIQQSTDLLTWTSVGDPITAMGERENWTGPKVSDLDGNYFRIMTQ